MSGQPNHANHPGPGEPAVFDLASGVWVTIVLVVVLCGGFGVLGLVSLRTGGVLGGPGVRIGVLVLSIVFLAIALAPLVLLRTLTRPRKLVIETGGIRWDDPRGKPWYVPWSELAGVSISRATRFNQHWSRTTLVRLDLHPGDDGFRERHPELAHLWEVSGAKQCYRLPIGPKESLLGEIDRALQTYAKTTYRGVIDEGTTGGLTYT